MAEKKVIKVLIAGKVMTMSGYESEEYMQKVAGYINSKIEEYEKMDFFRHASSDIKHRMLELNFADNYFKEKEHSEELESNLKEKINELDEMKHRCVNNEMKVETLQKEVEKLQKELRESEKAVATLTTTLNERGRNAEASIKLEEKREEPRKEEEKENENDKKYTQRSIEDIFPGEAEEDPGPRILTVSEQFQTRRNGKHRR